MAAEITTGHYVAQLIVKRVDKVTKSEYNNGARTQVATTERKVVELVSLNIREDDLEGLIDKVKKHADLVSDIDDSDD
jgi:hypothetical protein